MVWNKKTIKKILLTLGLSVITSFIFPVSVYQANLRIEPSSWTLIQNCEYNFLIKMDTQTRETTTIDSKLFLSGFDFVNVLNWDIDSVSALTWAATHGAYFGEEYLYINSYQWSSAISGDSVTVAQIQLLTHSGLQNTGFLDFYFLGSWVNLDDSNISNWENGESSNYTNYKDILYFISWWIYTFITGTSCEPPPLVVSGFYYQDTMIDSWKDYKVLDTQVLAWPQIIHNTWRDIWTNTAVELIMTGDRNLHIVESSLSGLPISIVDNNPDTISKTLIITWNTWPSIAYYDYSWSIGSGYSYDVWWTINSWIFYIDVFWIDQELPVITWIITYNQNTIDVLLSGTLWGANWTTKDDEYKILSFSWVNPAPTDYLSWWNTWNNLFSLVHSLSFSWAWTGDVIYMDRAWNTWYIFLELNEMNQYILQAHPASRLLTAFTPNPNLASRYTVDIYSHTWLFLTSWTTETNTYGTGIFETYQTFSWSYIIDIRWLSHLKTRLSWVVLNATNKLIDASNWALTRPNWAIKDDLLDYYFYYNQVAWSVFSNNLDIYALYNNNFVVRDAYNFLSANESWSQITSWVLRTWLSSSIWQSWTRSYQAMLKNTNINNFTIHPSYQIYSGAENITTSWFFNYSSWSNIVSVEIPGELVVDGEINGVDSSVIIQYIRDHGVMNTNTTFGLVAEDLNANGQVDAADITIHGYNLYRTSLY